MHKKTAPIPLSSINSYLTSFHFPNILSNRPFGYEIVYKSKVIPLCTAAILHVVGAVGLNFNVMSAFATVAFLKFKIHLQLYMDRLTFHAVSGLVFFAIGSLHV